MAVPGSASEPAEAGPAGVLPPLESGDHLTQTEFHRRYAAMPWLKKAELVEGVVYVASPVRNLHGKPHALIMTWLGTYQIATPGADLGDNTTVQLDPDNEVQPDGLLRLEKGGTCTVDEAGYLKGPPELVVEVAASSASYDLYEKLRAYRRNGVREYLIWQVLPPRFDWLELVEGTYVPLATGADGVTRSRVFPGLWLDIQALLGGDMVRVMAVLQQGLASPEHARFTERLSRA